MTYRVVVLNLPLLATPPKRVAVAAVGVVHAPAAHRVGDGPVRATVTVASMGVASTAMALVVLDFQQL